MKLHLLWLTALWMPGLPSADAAPAAPRPNILWITSEDHGPHMGCYGDTFATTPNVDKLAAKGMTDPDGADRYWGALGILMRGRPAVEAAQALGEFGTDADLKEVLPLLAGQADWRKHGVFRALAALNSLDALGPKAAPAAGAIKALPSEGPSPDPRYDSSVPRLVEDLQARFK